MLSDQSPQQIISPSLSLDGIPRPKPQSQTDSRSKPLRPLLHLLRRDVPPPILLFSVSGTQLSFRASLLMADNPSVVTLVRDQLPLESVLSHVVISDGTFWMPTRVLSLGEGNMVRRKPGAVYYYAPASRPAFATGRLRGAQRSTSSVGYLRKVSMTCKRSVGSFINQQTVTKKTLRSYGLRLA